MQPIYFEVLTVKERCPLQYLHTEVTLITRTKRVQYLTLDTELGAAPLTGAHYNYCEQVPSCPIAHLTLRNLGS